MQDRELKQALKLMLQAELDAMHYYQQASSYVQDSAASYNFNLLAQEELEHARTFYSVYPGDDLPEFEELVRQRPQRQLSDDIDPQLLGRFNERAALRLALKLEEEVAVQLQQMLNKISSPAAQAVIEENLSSTLGHYELINEDYQRLFAADETE